MIWSRANGGSAKIYNYNYRGDVINSCRYDAFGNEVTGSTDTDPFRYCGEYYDFESGNIYLRARYYNPQLGRFTTEDPIRSGNNWYAYGNNNPIRYIDPLGLDAILINKNTDIVDLVEHMAMFIQDENGDWYFFSWEADTVTYEKIEDPGIFESMDSINEYLYNKGYNKREKGNPYHSSVYVKGDFTASHNKASEYKSAYETSKSKGKRGLYGSNSEYSLLLGNCTQAVMSLFIMGTLPDGTNVGDYHMLRYYISIIPDVNLNDVQRYFYNNAYNIKGFNAAIKKKKTEYKNAKGFKKFWFWFINLEEDLKKIS